MFKQLISSWYNQSRRIMNISHLCGGSLQALGDKAVSELSMDWEKTDGMISKTLALDWGEVGEKKEGEECCL